MNLAQALRIQGMTAKIVNVVKLDKQIGPRKTDAAQAIAPYKTKPTFVPEIGPAINIRFYPPVNVGHVHVNMLHRTA